MKWVTQNKEVLDINEMSDSHIKNCVNQLENRINDIETAMACDEAMSPSSFTYAMALEELDKSEKYVKAFNKILKTRLTPMTNKTEG